MNTIAQDRNLDPTDTTHAQPRSGLPTASLTTTFPSTASLGAALALALIDPGPFSIDAVVERRRVRA